MPSLMVNTMGNVFHRKPRGVDKDVNFLFQTRELVDNPLYQYVNTQKGGRLMDLYIEEGTAAVEQVIQDEIGAFLYNNGKGGLIRKIDFVRWKNDTEAKMAGMSMVDTRPDELVLSDHKDMKYGKFIEHTACWDINKRGAVGETLLHMCVLHNTPIHTEIAKLLLRAYPKLALDYYEGEDYYGESALHLAIVYGDLEMVKLLVENGADVNQPANGPFFLPEDVKKGSKSISNTNYEGYAYFGEYPLAFAACFGHEDIYDYLIEHGADPNLHDSFGNTVLHMLVISNQLGMYSYAVKHHLKPANMEVSNYANLTPLTLASKLARNSIFKEIIELQSAENWRYSNISCSTYPLAPIDTIGIDGKTNWNSALMIITDGETDDHLEMLEGGVLRQLIDDKWKTYARRRFVERLIMAFFHLLMLSIAIYLRPECDSNKPCLMMEGRDLNSYVRYVAEIIVVFTSFLYTGLQLSEIWSQGIWGFLKGVKSAPAKSVFHVGCFLILLALPMRFLAPPEIEEVLVAIAAPCSWTFLLFFARGAAMLGPFIIIIYKMLASDIIRFVIIFVVFLIQFSQGFYFLFKDISDKNIMTFATPQGTIMTLFQMTLGEFKYEDFDRTHYPHVTKLVFAIFAILVPILLLNMLIAMMGNTYQQIIQRSEKEWRRQWAKIVIVLERTFSPKRLKKYQEEYSVPFGGEGQTRGLMVIKASTKTKARQRKGAISNWKKLVYEVKALIKERKRQGKSGPLDLTSSEVTEKLNERQLRKRRSQAMTKQGFSEDEDVRPSSSDGLGKGLMSALGQLAWEKDIDLNLSKSNNTFSSSKTHGILEEEADNFHKIMSPAAEKKPLYSKSNKAGLFGIDNPALELNDLSKTTNPKSIDKNFFDLQTITPVPKSVPENLSKHHSARPESSSSNASKGSKGHKKIGSGKSGQESSSSASSASRSNEDSMLLNNDKSNTKKPKRRGGVMTNSVGSISSLLDAWDDKKQNKTNV